MTCSRISKPGLVHHVTGEGDSCAIKHSGGRWQANQPAWAQRKCASPQYTEVYCAQTVQAVFRAVPKAAEATDPNESALLWLSPQHHVGRCTQASLSRGRHLAGHPRLPTCGKPRGKLTFILGRSDSETRKLHSRHVGTTRRQPRTICGIHIEPNPEGGALNMSASTRKKGAVPKGSFTASTRG